ncbi:hypothetical protein LX32DRAFT_654614 [Colletotrichum zoysiae]|uniref:Uncharacterized protein n=1 Tax=Colletotrichum zoysiae TaxID=1216348 RepID=A0AAD9M2M1_9PEZI|nr:hypothetical protein LX32DRAFT_654614 [Colletotrichum zoysiae]
MRLTLLLLYWLAAVGSLAQTHHEPGKSVIQSRKTQTTPLFDNLYWAIGRSSTPDDTPSVGGWYMMSYHMQGELQSGKRVEQWGLVVGRVRKTRHGLLYRDATVDFDARLYTARLVRKGSWAAGPRWAWGSQAWKAPPRRGAGVQVRFLGTTRGRRAAQDRLAAASDTWVRMAAARVPRLGGERQPIEELYTTGHGYMRFLEKVLSTDATMTAPPTQQQQPAPAPRPSQSQRPRKKVGWDPKNQYYPPPPRPTGGDDDDDDDDDSVGRPDRGGDSDDD